MDPGMGVHGENPDFDPSKDQTHRSEPGSNASGGSNPDCPPASEMNKSSDLNNCKEDPSKSSVYKDCELEMQKHRWIESQKAGRDLGPEAERHWVKQYWPSYLKSRWIEHLEGKTFWLELDKGDFGLMQRQFHDNAILLDRVLDRVKAGKENLDIFDWAKAWGIDCIPIIDILEALDMNSRRLSHRFD